MKNLIIALCALLVAGAGSARAGWDTGNAGDAIAAEFLFSGRDVLHRLEMLSLSGYQPLPLTKVRSVLATATVVSKNHVILDGHERDAASYPSRNLIEVNGTRWRELRQTSQTKARLTVVMHEILWMIGDDDTNFKRSGDIIDYLAIPAYSPSIWLNVPGHAFAVAECTGRLAEGSYVTVSVNTKGVTRAPDHGEVRIEKEGNTYGYRFAAEEIAQFFESDDAEGNIAMVGIGAYVGREFPLSVKYDGPNYVDMDLKAVIETGGNTPGGLSSVRNFMQVWKGPGHPAEDQFKVENPVCSVSSNN